MAKTPKQWPIPQHKAMAEGSPVTGMKRGGKVPMKAKGKPMKKAGRGR